MDTRHVFRSPPAVACTLQQLGKSQSVGDEIHQGSGLDGLTGLVQEELATFLPWVEARRWAGGEARRKAKATR